MRKQLELSGYAIAHGVLDAMAIERLRIAITALVERRKPGLAASQNARLLLETCPEVAELAASSCIRDLVEPVLGVEAIAVRGLLFDKVAGANWHVGWHQDLMIPIVERIETPGFTAWSVKEGIVHVRPPAEVLEKMLTLRVHLDDCPADNGPLEVLPGTHRLGIVPEIDVGQVIGRGTPQIVSASAGDVLLIRPLLLHSSRSATQPFHRRVVHLEFAGEALPGGLEWWKPREISP